MSWSETIEKRRVLESRTSAEAANLSVSVEAYQVAIAQAMFQLTTVERQAVGLRYLRSMTIADIANDLGMSWDGAHEAIDRGTENVREFIRGSQFEYPTADCEHLRQTSADKRVPTEIENKPELEVSL